MISRLKKWLNWHTHDWGKWELAEATMVLFCKWEKETMIQYRRCKTCGITETKEFK